ncbi:epimerase [Pseudofrankia sp. BMG5.36]|nr:epimerase [Pseudofrankia sp. BMG5.36]
MRVGLIGVGMIGSRVAAEARGRGHEVTAATRSGKGGTRVVDANDAAAVADLAAGQDAVVLSVRVASEAGDPLLAVGRPLLDGLREAGVRRLVVVGGAGSLEVAPGVRIIDVADIPDVYKREALAQADLLDLIRADADDLEWTYISPGGTIEPGKRTGVFRVGDDQLLVDDEGNSRISSEDYAVALVDELEKGENIRRRINVAY